MKTSKSSCDFEQERLTAVEKERCKDQFRIFSVGLKVHSRADVRNLLLLDRELIGGRNQRVDLHSSFRRVDLRLGRCSSVDSNLDGAEAIVEVGDQVDRILVGGGLKGKSKRKGNEGETKVSTY